METLKAIVDWLKESGIVPPNTLLCKLAEWNTEWGHASFYVRSPTRDIPDGTPLEVRGHDGAI